MASAGDSHIGLVRSENQDRHDSFDSPLGAIHLVADGMGGHCGGAKAAAMVVEGYRNALCSPSGPAEYRIALEAATAQTNREIHRLGRAGVPEYAGMGSTVVMALIRGWELVVAHVGDSRAYLCRGGRMLRLTRDHTAVQQLVDLGLLTETQARTHPTSSLLTRALGGESSVDIEISEPFSLLPGDTVMLCSDGLSGRVQDERIEGEIVRGHKNAESVVRSLISLALEAGGADNITVRCVRFNPPRKPAWNWLRTLI